MAIVNWPTQERPREKLAQQGASALSDAELLAIFLRTGVKGKSAVDIGRELLREYGGLREILTAEPEKLTRTAGLGPAKSAQLQAALEIGRRYLREKLARDGPLSSPQQTAAFLTHQLRDRPHEVFAVLFLDNRNRVVHYAELFNGSINRTTVHPREVVKCAMQHNAASAIIAHNHPSGVADPSQADTVMTAKVKAALELVDVELLDHLVIGDGEYVSMADRGLV